MRTLAGRPFGLFALAALAVAGGLLALAGVAGLRPLGSYSVNDFVIAPEVVRVVTAAWAAMLLAAAVLLVALRRWGWELAMLATGIGLLGTLWLWWLGTEEPIRLALLVASAFYLNGRDVRELLAPDRERSWAAPLAPPEGGLH
jgi:hypothetical protein